MTRILFGLKPVCPVLLIGLLAAMLLSTTLFAPVAYGSGGDEDRAVTESGESIWIQIDKLLRVVFGGELAASDQKSAARSGKRIGLQAGHWRYQESPPPFNTHTGGSGGGKAEPDVTLAIAQRAASILEGMGYSVEILPAWFPRGYTADALVAIHSDGAANPEARGFFADRYGNSAIADTDDGFMAVLNREYSAATGLPFEYRSTPNSRFYYGFTLVEARTPMVLIETGFLSNAEDREIIVNDPERAARGNANGIDKFLVP